MSNLTGLWPHEQEFGPTAGGRFDFTLLFEHAIFSIGPSAVLLLIAPLRLLQLKGQQVKVSHHLSSWLKIATTCVFAVLQLSLLVLWTGTPGVGAVSVAAASLSTADALALCALSPVEHARSSRPSTIICLYLVFSILLDAPQCRTLWLLPDGRVLAAVFTSLLSNKVFMLALESRGKARYLTENWQHLGPESTAGVFSKAFFWWLNDLMRRGFSTSLSLSSLYDGDEELRSEVLLARLQKCWDSQRSRRKHRLLLSVVHCNKTALLTTVIPRLFLIGFKFLQPFFINRTIAYVEGDKGSDPKSYAYGLMGAAALIYLGVTFSNGFYHYRLFRSMTMIRGSMVSMILFRAPELKSSSSNELGLGTLSLMSTDAEQIVSSFEDVHEIWANPIEIGLAIWLLYRLLGVGSIGPVIPVLVCTFLLMPQVAKRTGPAMKKWNSSIQSRVSTTSDVLGAVKEVKMLGTVEWWTETIQALREDELKLSNAFRTLIVFMNVIANIPSLMSPVLAFGIAIIGSNTPNQLISVKTVFTSLSIIGLIVGPLASLLSAVPSFASALGSFERIESFLEQTESSDASAHSTADGGPTLNTSLEEDKVLLSLHDVSITRQHGDESVMRNVDISIRSSTMTIVAGAVGSGKSFLLMALVGEMHISRGSLLCSTGVAYCSQSPWLTNGTIRNNIIGPAAYDENWYQTVLHACALDADLNQLPSRDNTMIGSKGLSLSGGQKQRLALARAVYSRNRLLVLDDTLSGLDSVTRYQVWHRIFATGGLLRALGTTVILATHTAEYLQESDSIITVELQAGIRAVRQITYAQLQLENSLLPSSAMNHFENESIATPSIEPSAINETAQPAQIGHLTPEEQDLLRSTGDTSLYIYYFNSIGALMTSLFIGTSALATFGMVAPQILLMFWTAANANDIGANTIYYFAIYLATNVAALILMGISIWTFFVVVLPRSAQNLHWTLLTTVMRAPLSFFATTDLGDIINRFSQDMSLVDKSLPTALFTTVSATGAAIIDAVLVFLGAKYLAAIIPFALALLYGLGVFYLRTSRQIRYLDLQAKAPLYTHLLETVDGLSTIRAYGWQSTVRDASMKLLDRSQRPYHLLFQVQRWLNFILDMFVTVSAFLLVTFAVLVSDSTTGSFVAVALYNLIGFNSTLSGLISSWTSLETSLGAISRLKSFEATTPVEAVLAEERPAPEGWPNSGGLSLKNITAFYTPGRPVIDNLSLQIKPGEKVAICGRTGSGKSSLILALFRLLDLDSGSIVIDDVDITQVPRSAVRRGLIVVTQQPSTLLGTVRSWLTQGCNKVPTDDDIIAALNKVDLWNVVSVHQKSLDATVDEMMLSQGQKQLLCLARAVLLKHQSKIIILDEAMSAMDNDTEGLMVQLLENDFAEHTVISVVHRAKTVRKFDTVVVLAGGKVVEIGAPEELLGNEDGQFRRLWALGG